MLVQACFGNFVSRRRGSLPKRVMHINYALVSRARHVLISDFPLFISTCFDRASRVLCIHELSKHH